MVNKYLLSRLDGIRQMLIGGHTASSSLSSATKGNEREMFLNSFLKEVMPPPFRFGNGDATDSYGEKSGQLDIVVEYPFLPSLPTPQSSSRLYLAESIATVIEVKSNLQSQWSDVLATASKLSCLRKNYLTSMSFGEKPQPPFDKKIPLFAVGYTGWKNLGTVLEKLRDSDVAGILVIDSGIYASVKEFGGCSSERVFSVSLGTNL